MTDRIAPNHGQDPAELLAVVYDELRRQAASYLERERVGHTLQPTALVHEAYMKLTQSGNVHFRDSAHFRAMAAQSMRQVLVDYARKRHASKRGGDAMRLALDDQTPSIRTDDGVDVLALHEALDQLSALDNRKARIVELRFFGGLTCHQVAETLDVSYRTVESDWFMARAWLRSQLSGVA
ncbi:MAG TPA: ECF-type sigma factor [Phycisphaerales bacterium]|nr:ECF-type sigma factor [Phycisphaerales bacterium]